MERTKSLASDTRRDGHITEDVLPEGSIDPVYQAKAELLNDAIQSIGMGKYQWHLFVVTGFGWLADIMWIVIAGIILGPVIQEFQIQGDIIPVHGKNHVFESI
ncbi:major facilitator superfamily transporter [Ceratobasidium sp. AG-Ba]|nr:major facilitator superfamily transporter [Ceratobasidium sp. AG-Ba]